ncbi:precorrin-3B synthase, partial [Rhodococcus sp. C26F]
MADTAVDVHLPAGHLTSAQVQLLAELAHTHGGGELHLTAHAQLQVRGDHAAISAAVTAAGLTVDVPTRARLLVSPLSGRIGGHHDLRELTAAVIARLDERPVAAGTVLGLD